VRMGRRFVYDSRGWRDVRGGMVAAASLVRSSRRLDLADLNWRRLTPVRQALLHASAFVHVDHIGRGPVRLVHRPGDAALAWLCAGWLASRLGSSRDLRLSVDEDRHGDAVLTLEVGDDAAKLSASLDSHRVVVNAAGDVAPLALAVPRETAADAIAAELCSLSKDVC